MRINTLLEKGVGYVLIHCWRRAWDAYKHTVGEGRGMRINTLLEKGVGCVYDVH